MKRDFKLSLQKCDYLFMTRSNISYYSFQICDEIYSFCGYSYIFNLFILKVISEEF